jgi:import receptor subunit TOM22
MVELEELSEQEKKIQEIVEDDLDEDFVDEDEEPKSGPVTVVSTQAEDDEDVLDESLLERIAALQDIIPPTARAHLYNAASSTVSLTLGLGKGLGSGLWILATGALLVFLPVSLELERDGNGAK